MFKGSTLNCLAYIYFKWNLCTELITVQSTKMFLDSFDSKRPVFSSPEPKVHVNYCHHLASVVCKRFTFEASSPKPLGQLEPNLAGMFIGWSSTTFLFFFPVGYSTWLPGEIICSNWLKFQRSSLKLMIGMFYFLFRYIMEDGGYSRTYITIGPYGKSVSKPFLSETTWTI